ncbi:hypothetical protein SAMN03159422_05187 [Agrobacterium fabrum]|uniref:hypothetical protein n=1 Tax=Agrobacterium fabrum TaxID=1176649 RepID=UPI00088256BC|nr:hypothetical protein [Agrobacterium fabrum]SDB74260.1 hypothetical protein SAMN03159422_05187 [Agrobacterium fabrum]SES22086.1 hypothetical protein SAMN03159504_05160 [Agrobacterium fabrum]
MNSRSVIPVVLLAATLIACSAEPNNKVKGSGATDITERPMDEVPVQTTLSDGDRQYSYKNGCVVVLEAKRAVVKSEDARCQSHHRDISLLYASGD